MIAGGGVISAYGDMSAQLNRSLFMEVRVQHSDFIGDDDSVIWGDEDKICLVTVARRIAGDDVAAAVQSYFGGTHYYLPATIGADNELAKLVGMETAQAIADEIGGCESLVPRGLFRPDLIIREVVKWGKLADLTGRNIAMLTGISSRHVTHVTASLRRGGNLPPKARNLHA